LSRAGAGAGKRVALSVLFACGRDIRRLSTEIVAFSPALGYVVDQLSQPDDRRNKAQ
jgi:hypothetical protein